MRKLTQAEIKVLRQFPKQYIDHDGGKIGGFILPGGFSRGTHRTTLSNLYKLKLIQIFYPGMPDWYPLELTDQGRRLVETITKKDEDQKPEEE